MIQVLITDGLLATDIAQSTATKPPADGEDAQRDAAPGAPSLQLVYPFGTPLARHARPPRPAPAACGLSLRPVPPQARR